MVAAQSWTLPLASLQVFGGVLAVGISIWVTWTSALGYMRLIRDAMPSISSCAGTIGIVSLGLSL